MKKFVYLFFAILMISLNVKAEKDYKFYLGIESNDKVEATVFDDFSFEIGIPENATVDPANVTISIAMKNVASLGVADEKRFDKTITTGLGHASVDFSSWLSKVYAFKGATINVDINELPCTWTISAWSDDAIIATTDAEVTRVAWHKFASNFAISCQDTSDSFVKIAAGCYLIYGNEKLLFNNTELGKGSLKFEDLAKVFEDAKVESTGAIGSNTYKPEIFVVKGSVLAIGNSKITAKEDFTIKIDASANAGNDITGKMSQLQNDIKNQQQVTNKIYITLFNLIGLVNDIAGIIDNANDVNVNIDFEETTTNLNHINNNIVYANKRIVNGQLLIIKDSKIFNAQGIEL